MKSVKRILSLILSLTMLLCTATTAFAADDGSSSIPDYATRHDIELVVEPGEIVADANTNDGIMPAMWDQQDHTITAGTTRYTTNFTVDERYFAYEAYATGSDGTALSGNYGVALMYKASSVIAGFSGIANGTTYKKDWITLSTTGPFCFRIINDTGSAISVHITYYSWT